MKRNLWVLMKKDIFLCPGWLMLGVVLTVVTSATILVWALDTGLQGALGLTDFMRDMCREYSGG